jgi:hypothetical protein
MFTRTKTASSAAILIALTILIGFTASGCSTGPPNKVVAKFSLAIMDRDATKAKRYCTDGFNNLYMAGVDQMMGYMPDTYTVADIDRPTVAEMANELEYTIDGNTAKVWYNEVPWVKYVLVKEGGSWKIDNLDLDMAGMIQEMGDMGFDTSQIPQH